MLDVKTPDKGYDRAVVVVVDWGVAILHIDSLS